MTSWRHVVRIAGRVLGLIAFLYMIYLIVRGDALAVIASAPLLAVLVPLAAMVYGVSQLALARAWVLCVALSVPGQSVPVRSVGAGYLRAQIRKYLPGNVFHYVSRHADLALMGFPHRRLVLATLYETVFLVAVAALVGLPALYWRGAGMIDLGTGAWVMLAVVLAAAVVLGAFLVLRRQAGEAEEPPNAARLGGIILCNLVFFLVSGVLFAVLSTDDTGIEGRQFLIVVSLVPLAWLIGFLTPGAPGGLGTREAAMVFLLAPIMQEPVAAAIAVVWRVVTIAGDALGWAIAGLVDDKVRSKTIQDD